MIIERPLSAYMHQLIHRWMLLVFVQCTKTVMPWVNWHQQRHGHTDMRQKDQHCDIVMSELPDGK